MANNIPYHLNGVLLGSCSCEWGCPCNFEMPPSRGFCEGGYLWHIEAGIYGQTRLDGLNCAVFAHSPRAIHLGNLTALYLVDDRATPPQRQALEEMLLQNLEVLPFGIFRSLVSTVVGCHYVPFHVDLQGIHSRATIPGILDLQLAPMKNPVTGEEELATLLKPTGFTSQKQELCASAVFRLTSAGLSYDHSGRYAEVSPFEYKSV